MTSERLTKLQRALEQAGLDAAAIIPGPTLAHLTGVSFHLMERPIVLLVSRGRDPALVLPEFEKTKAALIPFKVNAFTYAEDPSGWESVFKTAVAALRLDGKRIGVEPRQMRLLEFRHVRAAARMFPRHSPSALHAGCPFTRPVRSAANPFSPSG